MKLIDRIVRGSTPTKVRSAQTFTHFWKRAISSALRYCDDVYRQRHRYALDLCLLLHWASQCDVPVVQCGPFAIRRLLSCPCLTIRDSPLEDGTHPGLSSRVSKQEYRPDNLHPLFAPIHAAEIDRPATSQAPPVTQDAAKMSNLEALPCSSMPTLNSATALNGSGCTCKCYPWYTMDHTRMTAQLVNLPDWTCTARSSRRYTVLGFVTSRSHRSKPRQLLVRLPGRSRS